MPISENLLILMELFMSTAECNRYTLQREVGKKREKNDLKTKVTLLFKISSKEYGVIMIQRFILTLIMEI